MYCLVGSSFLSEQLSRSLRLCLDAYHIPWSNVLTSLLLLLNVMYENFLILKLLFFNPYL
jgi:hypothetical protein